MLRSFYWKEEMRQGTMAETKISPKRVMQELAAIAFARVPDYLELSDGDVQLKETLRPLQRAAIASIEKSSTGLKVKFYDKMKALELLGKHFGLFEGKENQTESKDNNLLEAILQATRQEVDNYDVSEFQ